MSGSDCDLALLRQSGAAVLLHSLTEQLLQERPSDASAWFLHQLQIRRFYLKPKHLPILLQSISSMDRQLVVLCLMDASPQGFTSYYTNEDVSLVAEYDQLVLDFAEKVAATWTAADIVEAQRFLRRECEFHRAGETPVFAHTVLALAHARLSVQQHATEAREAEIVEAAPVDASAPAAAPVQGAPPPGQAPGAPAPVPGAKKDPVRHEFQVDVVAPFGPGEERLLERQLPMVMRHLRWAFSPYGERLSFRCHLAASRPDDLLSRFAEDSNKGHASAKVVPSPADVACHAVKQSGVESVLVSEGGSSVAAVLEAVAPLKRSELTSSAAKSDVPDGVRVEVHHAVLLLDRLASSLHLGMVGLLPLPLWGLAASEAPAAVPVAPPPAETTKSGGKKGGSQPATQQPAPQPTVAAGASSSDSLSCVIATPTWTGLPGGSHQLFTALFAQLFQEAHPFRKKLVAASPPVVAMTTDAANELPKLAQGSGVTLSNSLLAALLLSSRGSKPNPKVLTCFTASTVSCSVESNQQFLKLFWDASLLSLGLNRRDAASNIETLVEKRRELVGKLLIQPSKRSSNEEPEVEARKLEERWEKALERYTIWEKESAPSSSEVSPASLNRQSLGVEHLVSPLSPKSPIAGSPEKLSRFATPTAKMIQSVAL